jgi:hypothetical protein
VLISGTKAGPLAAFAAFSHRDVAKRTSAFGIDEPRGVVILISANASSLPVAMYFLDSELG